jgi:hypothetical protein
MSPSLHLSGRGTSNFLPHWQQCFGTRKKPWTNVNFTAPRFTWRYQSHSIRSFLKKMHQPGNPFFGKASYVNQGLHLQNPMILKILNQSHLVQLRWTIQNEFIFKVAISYAATPFVFMFRHLLCRISPAIPNVTTTSVIIATGNSHGRFRGTDCKPNNGGSNRPVSGDMMGIWWIYSGISPTITS